MTRSGIILWIMLFLGLCLFAATVIIGLILLGIRAVVT